MMRTIRCGLVVSMLMMAGCMGVLDRGELGLHVEAPVNGAVVGSTNVRVSGTANTDHVLVQGRRVEVVEGRWGTTFEAATDGAYEIEVRADTDVREIAFTVDSIPPVVRIDEPSGFIDGDTFRVVGRVVDSTDVVITADGEPVSFGPDGSFVVERAVAPGAHRMRVRATDAAGHTVYTPVAAIVGDLAPYGAPVEDAAALTLGAAAFVEVSTGVRSILNSADFRQLLRASLIGSYGDVRITAVEFGSADFEIAPVDGGLWTRARIHGVWVGARACFGPSFARVCVNGDLRVETLEVAAQMATWAEEGQLRAAAVDASVSLHGFSYDIHGVPGFIEGIFRGTIRDAIESQGRGAVIDLLNTEVPNQLSEVGLDAAIDLLGSEIALEGSFREVTADPMGLHVRLDLGTWATTPHEDRMAYAYLRQAHPALSRPDVESVSVSVAVDTMNALTFSIWSGFVPIETGPLPGLTEGGLTVADLARATRTRSWTAPADAAVTGSIDLASPPVVTTGELGELVITCADARLTLAAVIDDETTEPLVTLSLGLSAPVTVAPDAEGVLQVVLGDLTITADALDAPLGFLGGEDLDVILGELAPMLTAGALDFGGVEMPSLLGFTFEDPLYSVRANVVRLDATLTYTAPSGE